MDLTNNLPVLIEEKNEMIKEIKKMIPILYKLIQIIFTNHLYYIRDMI